MENYAVVIKITVVSDQFILLNPDAINAYLVTPGRESMTHNDPYHCFPSE